MPVTVISFIEQHPDKDAIDGDVRVLLNTEIVESDLDLITDLIVSGAGHQNAPDLRGSPAGR